MGGECQYPCLAAWGDLPAVSTPKSWRVPRGLAQTKAVSGDTHQHRKRESPPALPSRYQFGRIRFEALMYRPIVQGIPQFDQPSRRILRRR